MTLLRITRARYATGTYHSEENNLAAHIDVSWLQSIYNMEEMDELVTLWRKLEGITSDRMATRALRVGDFEERLREHDLMMALHAQSTCTHY